MTEPRTAVTSRASRFVCIGVCVWELRFPFSQVVMGRFVFLGIAVCGPGKTGSRQSHSLMQAREDREVIMPEEITLGF